MPALAVELTDEQHEMIKQEAARSGRSQESRSGQKKPSNRSGTSGWLDCRQISRKSEKLNELLA